MLVAILHSEIQHDQCKPTKHLNGFDTHCIRSRHSDRKDNQSLGFDRPHFLLLLSQYPTQANASGLLAPRLNKETLAQHTRIWSHDRSPDCAPSDTTYDMLVHRFKTVRVTALNRKAPTNLLP